MSDGLPQTGNAPRIIQQAQARGEQVVRLVSLPEALENNARAQRLEGEVVRQNQDGSTRIRTPQGDVDIEIRGRQPQPGQRVEVDVPAGRPPRQAVVRNAPDPAPQQRAPDQQPVQTQLARTQVRADVIAQNARSDQARALIDNTVRPQPSQQTQQASQARPAPQAQSLPLPTPQTSNPAAPLPPGTPVRLTPISTAQVQQFLNTFTQTIQVTPTTIQTAAFQAVQAVQNVLNQNTQTLLTLTQSPAPQLPQAPVQTALQPTPQAQPPILQNPVQTLLQTQTLPQSFTAPVQILPASAQATPSTPLQNIPPVLQTLTFTALPASPIATTPVQPIQAGFTPTSAFDVKVQNILQNTQLPLTEITAAPRETARPAPLPAQIGLPQSITAPTAQAGQIGGQVTGFTPQNLPIVSFQFVGQSLPQSFVLQYQAANLTLGSQIIVQPNALTTPNAAQAAGQITGAPQSTLAQVPQALLAFGNQFPPLLMEETYQTLLQAAPALAANMARALPSPANPAQLGAAALLFLTAVRSNDLSSWLGDRKIDILQRLNQTNLLSRLTGGGGTPAPQASVDVSAPSGEWRAVPLPMFWDGEIQRVNLFVKKDQDGQETDDVEKTQTRFIFDLTLSRMGDVQVDGLMREDRLDMVIRTQNPLSAPMQQVLKQVYTKALDSEALRGELGFQGDPRQWVNILKAEQNFGAEA